MQSLWSRTAHLKSTCRCPSCLTASKQGLSRSTTSNATRLTRNGTRFTFYTSSLLATATIYDSTNKDQKRRDLSRQIAEARSDLDARREEQDRRLAALGKGLGGAEREGGGEVKKRAVDEFWDGEAWNDEDADTEYHMDTNSHPGTTTHRFPGRGPRHLGNEVEKSAKGQLVAETWDDENVDANYTDPSSRSESTGHQPPWRESYYEENEDGVSVKNRSVDEVWYEENFEIDFYADASPHAETVLHHISRTGPRTYRLSELRNQYAKSILGYFDEERQKSGQSLRKVGEVQRDERFSAGPPRWSPKPATDRHLKMLRDSLDPSYECSNGGPGSAVEPQRISDEQEEREHDLRILKMQENPAMDDRIEHIKECYFENWIQIDQYLQNVRKPVPPDDPHGTDASQRWSSLLEWITEQRRERQRLGFGEVPGISLQELQAFAPPQLEEITENNLIMAMVRGIPSRQAWTMSPYSEHLSAKRTAIMTMAMYKLVLSILQLLHGRENARRQPRKPPPSSMKARQVLIDFWSHQIGALNQSNSYVDASAFPLPPLPVYDASLHHYSQAASNQNNIFKNVLHSPYITHEEKVTKFCIHTLRSNVPINIHAFNTVLIYLCDHSDYDLAWLFIKFLEETHLRPNEVTIAEVLRFHRLSGRRQGFQNYVAKMHGRNPGSHGMIVRNPMVMVPLLARSKFTIKVPLLEPLGSRDSHKVVELTAEPYRPFPTDQQEHPRIYEKGPFSQAVYCELIHGALRFGYIDDAFTYCIELVRYGWNFTGSIYHSLLKYCTDTRDWVAGYGIWVRRDVHLSGHNAKVYIEALKLCVVCGKTTEYGEILTDGIRTGALSQEAIWPVATLTTMRNKSFVSIQLSWVIGLEAELRSVTTALGQEVENLKKCIDNARGEVFLYPIDVQSQLQEDERTNSPAPSAHDQGDDSARSFEKCESACYGSECLALDTSDACQASSNNSHETSDERLVKLSLADAAIQQTDLEEDCRLEAQELNPGWSYDLEPTTNHSDPSIESFKELEDLLSWPAEPGYPSPQDMDDQDYVVVPAVYNRRCRFGPSANRDLAGSIAYGDAPSDHVLPIFRSIQLDRGKSEESVRCPNTTSSDETNDPRTEGGYDKITATVERNPEVVVHGIGTIQELTQKLNYYRPLFRRLGKFVCEVEGHSCPDVLPPKWVLKHSKTLSETAVKLRDVLVTSYEDFCQAMVMDHNAQHETPRLSKQVAAESYTTLARRIDAAFDLSERLNGLFVAVAETRSANSQASVDAENHGGGESRIRGGQDNVDQELADATLGCEALPWRELIRAKAVKTEQAVQDISPPLSDPGFRKWLNKLSDA